VDRVTPVVPGTTNTMKHTLASCVLAALLTGCNVEVVMPVGGSLVSASGLYGCAAAETCTLAMDHAYFYESFEAVAAPGYRFSHWGDAPGNFCAGRSEPTCDEIDTRSFLGKPLLLDYLRNSASFSLTPVFVRDGDTSTADESPWKLISDHQEINYEVTGNTPADILDALSSDANPLSASAVTGSKPVGYAWPRVRWSYEIGEDSTGERCAVTAGTVSVGYFTTLPQLAGLAGKPASLQTGWTAFQQDVRRHEIGHQQLYRSHIQGYLSQLSAIGEVPCDQIAAEIRAAYDQLFDDVAAADDAYHSEQPASTSFSDYF
jgi:predicted secreted Zn-dependent protease